MSLPSEIASALGSSAEGAHHVRLRSGVDSPTGEAHLVVTDGALRVFARASMLDPLVEVPNVRGANLVVTSLRSEVHLDRPPDLLTIALGFGEAEQVEALLTEIEATVKAPPVVEAGTSPLATTVVPETRPAAASSAKVDGLDAHRAHLLSLLAARLEARRAHLKREAERTERKRGESDDRAKRSQKKKLRREQRARSEPIATPARALVPAPAPTDPPKSSAPWVVLAVLIAVGVGAAVRRLILHGV